MFILNAQYVITRLELQCFSRVIDSSKIRDLVEHVKKNYKIDLPKIFIINLMTRNTIKVNIIPMMTIRSPLISPSSLDKGILKIR
jgi:hypothetical protein